MLLGGTLAAGGPLPAAAAESPGRRASGPDRAQPVAATSNHASLARCFIIEL
jgi:hypothetical protein